MMLHIDVPVVMAKPCLTKFRGRLGTRRSLHFFHLRSIIGEATGVHQLQAPSVKFQTVDRDSLRVICQSKQFWDVHKEPFDISWLAAADDPLGSEIFIHLIALWNENVRPTFNGCLRLEACPPLEEFILILRMVCLLYLLVFVLTFCFPDQRVLGSSRRAPGQDDRAQRDGVQPGLPRGHCPLGGVCHLICGQVPNMSGQGLDLPGQVHRRRLPPICLMIGKN